MSTEPISSSDLRYKGPESGSSGFNFQLPEVVRMDKQERRTDGRKNY